MTMRLLLLFSALLAALTGVSAGHAAAQPVQASAAASIAVARAVAVSPASVRFAVTAYGNTPPRRLAIPSLTSAVTARVLYAERRRE